MKPATLLGEIIVSSEVILGYTTLGLLLSVLALGTCVVGVGIVLFFQLVSVTGDLPKYRAAIRGYLVAIRITPSRRSASAARSSPATVASTIVH